MISEIIKTMRDQISVLEKRIEKLENDAKSCYQHFTDRCSYIESNLNKEISSRKELGRYTLERFGKPKVTMEHHIADSMNYRPDDEPSTGLTFIEAIAEMEDGKWVKRKNWDKRLSITKGFKNVAFEWEYFCWADWEIVNL